MTISPNFRRSFGILERHRPVDRDRVSRRVGGIVREAAEGEGVLVEVLRLADQADDEIARADVVHEVAEQLAAERVVAHVLDDRPGIGVGVRLEESVGRGVPGKRRSRRGLRLASQAESMMAS